MLQFLFWYFGTRSSHLPVPPPLPSPLQLSCRSHREIGCAGPGGCRASPGRGGRAGPPCSWSSQKGEISRRNLHMGHPVFFGARKRIIISRIDGIIWGSSPAMDDSYMFIPPVSSNFTSFEMWAFPSRSIWDGGWSIWDVSLTPQQRVWPSTQSKHCRIQEENPPPADIFIYFRDSMLHFRRPRWA